MTRRPELNLLNVLKRDEARHPILRVDDHKGWDGRIDFLRDRRKVNEIRMIDGKAIAGTGNDHERRKRIGPNDIRNLFSGHKSNLSQTQMISPHYFLVMAWAAAGPKRVCILSDAGTLSPRLFASICGWKFRSASIRGRICGPLSLPSPHPNPRKICGSDPSCRH